MKLTVLNGKSRVGTIVDAAAPRWLMRARVDYGWGHVPASYGKYSGEPASEETYIHAKTILSP